MNPYHAARMCFNSYAAMGEGEVPSTPQQAMQVAMYRWLQDKVHHGLPVEVEGTLGVSEELGELAAAVGQLNHAILNHHQKRRGYEEIDKLRSAVADALADMTIFAMSVCTAMRLDYWTLVNATAEEVMRRDWKKNPLTAHLEK